MMVDRHPNPTIYSQYAIGLGRDKLKWDIPLHKGNVGENRYRLVLDELAFVKQHTDRQMTMHQKK